MNRQERRKQQKLQQTNPANYINQACDYMNNNRHDLAYVQLQTALKLSPTNIDAMTNMGECLRVMRRFDDAIKILTKVVQRMPNFLYGRVNLGAALGEKMLTEEAIEQFLVAIKIDPNFNLAHMNLGELYRRIGILDKALEHTTKALSLKANDTTNLINHGTVLKDMKRFDEAAEYYRKAVKINPNFDQAWVNIATTDLMLGNLKEGFKNFEWRFNYPIFNHLRQENFPKPKWKGEPLEGKTILLYGEQGYGDAFQFIRYAENLKNIGAKVIVWIFEPLYNIFKSVPFLDGVYRTFEELPPYDYHISEMSLPYMFGTEMETIPQNVPYIFAEKDKVEYWKEKLKPYQGLKVGITWAGNPGLSDDIQRSTTLDKFIPLLSLKDVNFFSLQHNSASQQIKNIPEELRPINFMDEVKDFTDTAGLVENLDLVIAVDTSIVHLTGAMNKPIWVLSRYNGCWRWLLNRDDNPWYPSSRIYRLSSPGNWEECIARVTQDLAERKYI